MKKHLLAAFAILMLIPPASRAADNNNILLVVPARQRMIQLAFDMSSLRGAEVVSWIATKNPEAPELNYWTGNSWEAVSKEDFVSYAKLREKPDKVIFMGLDIPDALTESFAGAARFETFDPAMLINNLDAFYSFSNSEWRFLAKRYGFMLKDVNARLRKENRFTNPPPVEKKRRRSPIIFDDNGKRSIDNTEKAEADGEEIEPVPAAVVEPAEEIKTETEPEKEPEVEPEAELKPEVEAEPGKVDEEPAAVLPEAGR